MLAAFVADRLGRTFVGATTDLADTAGRLAGGDLDARARLEGPPEIREVGTTLNQLAVRIRKLLTAEREAVADASHRLRTPITVLRLTAGELRDGPEREQVVGYVDEVTEALSEVIREARQPVREGLGARCDPRAVAAARTAFWAQWPRTRTAAWTSCCPPGRCTSGCSRTTLLRRSMRSWRTCSHTPPRAWRAGSSSAATGVSR